MMNSVEFLRSCVTNIIGTEKALDVAFAVYEIEDAQAPVNVLGELVAILRARDKLCSIVDGQIWVFGALESEVAPLLQPRYTLTKTRAGYSMPSASDPSSADAQFVRSVFIDAVEGSLAFSLSSIEGLVHSGPWKWLYVPARSTVLPDAGRLFHIRVECTRMDTCLFYLKSHPCCLSRVNDDGDSWQVVLAPNGHTASVLKPSAGLHGQSLLDPPSKWKDMVAVRLASEGIRIAAGERWVPVRLTDAKVRDFIWWPSRLCLTFHPSLETCTNTILPNNWKQWFHTLVPQDVEENFQDPLDFAQEWFHNDVQRARAVESAVENSLDTMESIVVSPLVTSPPFNQHNADLQAAMLGVYPTPPDGMMPGPAPSLHTSTSEGLIDVQQVMEITQFSDSVDTETTQVEDVLSTNDITTYHGRSHDLFGDIGGIESGANEVGDADFDYFDEPDEDANFEDGIVHGSTAMQTSMLMSRFQPDAAQDEMSSATPALISSNRSSPISIVEGVANLPEAFDIIGESDPASVPLPTETQSRALDPLSPFHIRERLLPPPVPASATQRTNRVHGCSRTFGPMNFNEGIDFVGKSLYVASSNAFAQMAFSRTNSQAAPGGIEPSEHRLQGRMDIESSDDESMSSAIDSKQIQQHALPPSLPWNPIKRKRSISMSSESSSSCDIAEENAVPMVPGQEITLDGLLEVYNHIFARKKSGMPAATTSPGAKTTPFSLSSDLHLMHSTIALASIDILPHIMKADLITIAQLVTEQAIFTNETHSRSFQTFRSMLYDSRTADLEAVMRKSIRHAVLDADDYSLSRILATRDEPHGSSRANTVAQTLQGTPNSLQSLPASFSIAAPYIRMQRGADSLDVLPSAVPFWQTLGLGPASGPKDIGILLMAPDGASLLPAIDSFVTDLRQAYEGSKLGILSQASVKGHQNGIVLVHAIPSERLELADVLKAYAAKCSELGRSLAESEQRQRNQTTVVFLVNPFEGDSFAIQYLCACFWMLFRAYQESTKPGSRPHSSDIVLQIIPVSLIASPTGTVSLDAQRLAALAMEIYDRCPLTGKFLANSIDSSTLSILAGPALHLASFTHRRVGFQPTAEPPSDLLQEGSILHVAYALSDDEQWTTICWIGSEGGSQQALSLSTRGKSFAEIAAQIWEQTLDTVAARDVMWRVFLTTAAEISEAVDECWKKVVTARPRKQMLHVTLLSLNIDPPEQIMLQSVNENARWTANATTPGGGFLTPASTPQAAAFTVSPDANGTTTAPLTPAPSDLVAGVAENDSDAYLMDSADEAWGLLLSPSITRNSARSPPAGITHGLLLRRGLSDDKSMEALGVELHWDIRVRPNGFVDNGHPKQIESNLREVLKLYRYLCVLTHVRGMQRSSEVLLPVHVHSALRGALALNGFMQ